MRVPILHMGSPEQKFWLTYEQPEGPRRQVVLTDANGHLYRPADLPGAIIIKAGTCSQAFYHAAEQAGYQVVWID
jgi:hypothetical protein